MYNCIRHVVSKGQEGQSSSLGKVKTDELKPLEPMSVYKWRRTPLSYPPWAVGTEQEKKTSGGPKQQKTPPRLHARQHDHESKNKATSRRLTGKGSKKCKYRSFEGQNRPQPLVQVWKEYGLTLAQFSAFVLRRCKHVHQIYTACRYFHALESHISSVKVRTVVNTGNCKRELG